MQRHLYIIMMAMFIIPAVTAQPHTLGVYEHAVMQYQHTEAIAIASRETYESCNGDCTIQRENYLQRTKEYYVAATDVLHFQLFRINEYMQSKADEEIRAEFSVPLLALDAQIVAEQERITHATTEEDLQAHEATVQELWQQTEAFSTTVIGKVSNDRIGDNIRSLLKSRDKLRAKSASLAAQGKNTTRLDQTRMQFEKELYTLQQLHMKAQLQYEQTEQLETIDADELTNTVVNAKIQLGTVAEKLSTVLRELRQLN